MDTINMLSAQMSNMVKVLNKQTGYDPSSSSNVHALQEIWPFVTIESHH